MKILNIDFNQDEAKKISKNNFVKKYVNIFWQEYDEEERCEKLAKAWEVLNDKVKKGEQPVSNEGGAE
jgi:hypothetical protein